MNNVVGILSYGCGNIKSVINAIEYCGVRAIETDLRSDINNFDKLILPGVGAFDHAIDLLEDNGMLLEIKDWVACEDNKLLGICLGMQLLCRTSEESKSNREGFGLIPADVIRLQSKIEQRLPNIGWGKVDFTHDSYSIFSSDYYFVHSYGVSCDSPLNELAYSYYGDTKFSSAITNNKNIYGYQFHPEKSHKKGLDLLKGFCDL